MIDLDGSGEQHNVDTYDSGLIEGSLKHKFMGVGSYTYYRLNFEYNGFPVVSGMTFGGLPFSGIIIKHGESGDLSGLKMRGTWSGVSIQEPFGLSPLWGVNLVSGTGFYK